ncbi:hypothetical protein GC173_02660 [bacterium]|nr:hypothetical protein [bacterium]
MTFARLLTFVVCLLMALPGGGQAQIGSRAMGRPRSESVSPVSSGGNAGLFIGVGEFEQNDAIPNLRFAVNDAVGLAYAFSLGLGLIPPERVRLALSGEPSTEEAKTQLAALVAAGATRVDGRKKTLLDGLTWLAGAPRQSSDMVFYSVATHGFEEGGAAYVMPSDGDRNYVKSTAIALEDVKSRIGSSVAEKRLIIIDACRENLGGGTRSLPAMSNAMEGAFRAEFERAAGMAVLMACGAAELSHEEEQLGHGVYTHHLLRALRSATPDDAGFIRLDTVAGLASEGTRQWANQRGKRQNPWYAGDEGARLIPLAIDNIASGAFQQDKQRATVLLKQIADKHVSIYTPETFNRVQDSIQKADGSNLYDLIKYLESGQTESDSEHARTFERIKPLIGIGVAAAPLTNLAVGSRNVASGSIQWWMWVLPLLLVAIVVAALMLRPRKVVAHASTLTAPIPGPVTPAPTPTSIAVVPVVEAPVVVAPPPPPAPPLSPRDRLHALLMGALRAPAPFPSAVWTEHSTATPPSTRDLGVAKRHEEHAWATGQRVRICFQPGATGHTSLILFGSSGRVQLVCPNTPVEAGRVRLFPDERSSFTQEGNPDNVDLLFAITSTSAQGWMPSLRGQHLLRYLDEHELKELVDHIDHGVLRSCSVSSTSWRARG